MANTGKSIHGVEGERTGLFYRRIQQRCSDCGVVLKDGWFETFENAMGACVSVAQKLNTENARPGASEIGYDRLCEI